MVGFLRRNPSIKTQRARKIDNSQIKSATKATIRAWFENLKARALQAILAENWYNMDETGIMEGQGDNGLVLGERRLHRKDILQKKQPGSRTWTTIVECISASGKALPPLVITKGASIQQQYYPLDLSPFKDWFFNHQKNDWIDDDIALEWLKRVFIPKTKPARDTDRRLLILDGHGSHTTDEFMWLAYQNNIQLLYLPAHCSHILQPLDLSVFSVLKRAYRRHLQAWMACGVSDTSAFGRRTFLECYQKAREEAISERTVRGGWKAGGLWPQDINKPLNNPLLLENANRARSATPEPSQPVVQATFDDSDTNEEVNELLLTPRKPSTIAKQVAHLIKELQPSRDERHMLRNWQKMMNESALKETVLKRKQEEFDAKMGELEGKKRKKVKPNPNAKFVTIANIRAAQREVGRDIPDLEDSEGPDVSDSEDSDESEVLSQIECA